MKYLSNRRYCASCHGILIREGKTWNRYGWCSKCNDIVASTRCKVSYWMITATFLLSWSVSLPGL